MGWDKVKRQREKLSLEELEGDNWGDPEPEDTQLASTVMRLRRKPIEELSVEDLRIMIGQQTSLNILVPMALEVLEKDSAAEGDLYPGDLYASMTRIPDSYWQSHPEQKAGLDRIVIPES